MALLEREGSGCRALLENERTEDLTRLYNLFWKIKDGLEPVGVIVKNHIEAGLFCCCCRIYLLIITRAAAAAMVMNGG